MIRAAAACLVLAACATADVVNSPASKEWGDCIAKAVKRFDDGKTDPVSIAYGVAPQCGVQYQQLTELMVSQYMTEGGQANMRALMRANEVKSITSAVLIFRKGPD